MPAQKRNKLSKSDRRREQILREAVSAFDRQGFANTSLDDIAKGVGVSREAIYYYFKNRTDILLAIIKPQGEALLESMLAIVKSDRDPREKLLMAVRNHLERFNRNAVEMTITLRDVYVSEVKEIQSHIKPYWKKYDQLWTQLIASGQEAGVFMTSGDPKIIAFGVLGMCNWMGRWYNPRKLVSLDEIIDTFAEILSFGIVNEGDRNSPWFIGNHGSTQRRRLRPAASMADVTAKG